MQISNNIKINNNEIILKEKYDKKIWQKFFNKKINFNIKDRGIEKNKRIKGN